MDKKRARRVPTAFDTSLGHRRPSQPFLDCLLERAFGGFPPGLKISAEINAQCPCEARLVPNKHQPACYLRIMAAVLLYESYFESFKFKIATGPTDHPVPCLPVRQIIFSLVPDGLGLG